MVVGGLDRCSGETIAPHQDCWFDLEFAPTAPGAVTGSINVVYNGTSPAIALNARGIVAR